MKACPETKSARGYAANRSRLHGKRHRIKQPFFTSQRRNPLRHADPKIHHIAGPQFFKATRRNPPSRPSGKRLKVRHRHRPLPHITCVELAIVSLPMILAGSRHNHRIHKNPRNTNRLRIAAVVGHNTFNLHNHGPAITMRRLRYRQHLTRDRFTFHRNVAAGIARSSTQQCRRNLRRSIPKHLHAINRHSFH